MGECAFNLSKLRDFSRGQLCGYHVAEDVERLHISNIDYTEDDRENLEIFCAELCSDYNNGFANYEAWLRPRMDARIAWELRKSAILWEFMEGEKDPWFFLAHKASWNAEEIKEYRASILIQKFQDYCDLDWQYFWVMRMAKGLPKWVADSYFDMEIIYQDRDELKPDQLGDPPHDLAWRLATNPDWEPKCRQGRPEIIKL